MSLSVYASNKLKPRDNNDAWSKLYNLVPNKKRVLDVGCSSGNFGSEIIKKKKCQVVGIDINPDDVAIAKKQLTSAYVLNVEVDDISFLGTFDVIIMADVIEHLLDASNALIKLKQLLNTDGVLIFSVPNMSNIAVRLELLAGRFEYTEYGLLDETHLHYFDRIEFEKTLNKAGFEISRYDCTVRDVPRDFIHMQLEEIGLKVTEKFWEIAESKDATTFQFIGTARPSRSVQNVQLASKTPYDFVSRSIDTLKEEYENKLLNGKGNSNESLKKQQDNIKSISESLKDRGAAIAHLEGVVREKQDKISTLESTITELKSRSLVKRIKNK